MSLPDGELDEPSDSEWCFLCEDYQPCGCRDDKHDRDLHDKLDESMTIKERSPEAYAALVRDLVKEK